VDACKHGLGAVLLQEEKPVAYASKSVGQSLSHHQAKTYFPLPMFDAQRLPEDNRKPQSAMQPRNQVHKTKIQVENQTLRPKR